MIQTIPVEPAARVLLDDEALRCLYATVAWAEEQAMSYYSLSVDGVRVRHWRSFEDTSVEEVVITLDVSGSPDDALEFMDAVSHHLGGLVEHNQTPAAAKLSVEVLWH